VLSESYSVTGRGKEFSYLRLTINCRVRLPHMSRIASRAEHSSLALRDQHELPLKSMLLTNLIFTCIGVMHIVDIYASRDLNQVSLSLLRTTPNNRSSRSSPFREWWAAFRSYMGQMFDKTRDQMNNWRWDNPRAIGDEVDRSNPQTTSSGKVKHTSERFSWYGSHDLRAKIEPPSCRQYKPGDCLAI
jgi:hypothetical protein